MNFQNLTNSVVVETFGWTLVHSLWQIAFVAAVLLIVLRVAARSLSANARYLIACAALGSAFALPVATFIWLQNANVDSTAQRAQIRERQRDSFDEKQFDKAKTLREKQTLDSPSSDANRASFQSLENLKQKFNQILQNVLPFLVWAWFFGAAIFAARTIGGFWQLRRLRSSQTKAVSQELQTRFADLCRKTGVAQSIKILESAIVRAPIVVGWLKPIVLIPASALSGLSPVQLETILVHELMHIRRADFLVNLAQTFVEIVFFYHPAAWRISNEIRVLREFACDDATVDFYGERTVYARALANLETLRQTEQAALPQLTLAADGGKLMTRIKRILQKETETARPNALWSAVFAAVLISAFVLTAFSPRGAVSVNAGSKPKQIAVGFVSIPPVDRSANPPHDASATMRILVEKLKKHRVPAIGFLTGAQISDGEKMFPARAEIIRNWRDAGFEIGIGGYKHIWFYDTPLDDYIANAEKNERVARLILAEKNLPLQYFSYPFLNTGKTLEDRAAFENWLRTRDLKSVKYTFDNQEWMYSFAYDKARGENDISQMKQIRAEFLNYMAQMLRHYEAYSDQMFNRQIAQTLVLTPSRLVADSADELFGMFEQNNYEFVSIDRAQSDDAYKTPDDFAGVKAGISWFERWTLAQNKKLRDEPQVNENIEKIWNDAQAKK